jgi:hypothetical protein
VDRDVSFGPEHHSLRIRGAGGRARLTPSAFLPQPDDVITIDLDLLPKGDAVHMQFTPVGSAVGTDEVRVAVVPAAGDGQVIELRTIGGRWRCGGAKLVDTGVPVDFDAWNHVQLAVDTARRTYRISLQVVGSAPQLLHEGPLDSLPPDGTPLALELGCVRKSPRADGPAFDNVLVTQRNP